MAGTETSEGFQFYLRFAKPLVLNLPSPKDRVLAAAWIQKLKEEKSGTNKLRTDYLKLLLFVLQKRKLFGPFVNNPAQYDKLEEFPMSVKLRDVAKAWIDGEESHKRARMMEGMGAGDFPPLTTECSADMLEYVAAQDIPNFGVHAYYAISNEPIHTWENLEKGIFPKGALSMVRKAESTSASVCASGRKARSQSRSRSRSKTADDTDFTGKERTGVGPSPSFKSDYGSPGRPFDMTSPLGSPPPPDRSPPTWGSNLISVRDPPTPEGLKFAPDADKDKDKPKETPSKTPPTKDEFAASSPQKTPPSGVRRKLEFTEAEQSPSKQFESAFEMSPVSPYQGPAPSYTIERSAYPDIELPQITMPPPIDFDLSPERAPFMPYTGPMPTGDTPDMFAQEPPSFLTDEDIMTTPPRPSRDPFAEQPSLPYQTPEWDMSAPSLPYRSPTWDMSAPSLPYMTPAYDPTKAAEAQYASLFDSPPMAASSPKRPARRAAPRTTFQDELAEQMEQDEFSRMEKMFEEEDITRYTDDFSALEEWAETSAQTPPQEIPQKKVPKEDMLAFLKKGVKVSPEAQDIVDDAIREMSMSVDMEPDPDLEDLYAEEDAAYPGRIPGMRTPPVFSKSARIREAGQEMRYPQSRFGIREPVDWKPAEEFVPGETMPSPPMDPRPKPFKEVFPSVDFPLDYMPFDDEELSLIDDEKLIRSPNKRDLRKRLIDVMNEIDRIGDEVPALGGIGLTTPKRSPSPIRSPDKEDDEYFFFIEKPPEDFGKSPEDYMSPATRAEAQWEQLLKDTATPSPPPPSPPRFPTPEFIREERRARLSPKQVLFPPEERAAEERAAEPEPEPEPEETPSERRRRKKRKKRKGKREDRVSPSTSGTSEEDSDEEGDAVVNQEVEELYKSLLEEEEEELAPPAIFPVQPPSPTRIEWPTPPKVIMPPKYEYRTPPRRRITREEFPDALEFEEEPSFVEPWLLSPPTPPSPFEYYSPELEPLDDSPPLRELVEAHEYTDDFFDPNRPHMRTSVTVRGKRVPLSRHSRAPPLTPITDFSGYGFQMAPSPPPPTEEDLRIKAMIRAMSPPTPEAEPEEEEVPASAVCPRVTGEETEGKKSVCKVPSKAKGAKPSTSKTRMGPRARPSTSKSKLKTTSKTKLKGEKTPGKQKPAGPSESVEVVAPDARTPPRGSVIQRPLTLREHRFAESFADPKHRELYGRVVRIVADVRAPPEAEAPPPERHAFEGVEELGGMDFDVSPPRDVPPPDEDLPELTPPSPLPEIPEFDFQPGFMPSPPPRRSPTSPRSPGVPSFSPFPYPGTPTPPRVFDESPPERYDSPEASPEIESPESLIFYSEILGQRTPPPPPASFTVRSGSYKYEMQRHSARPRVRRILETPETEEFEEHMPFHERLAALPPGPVGGRRSVRAGTKRVSRRSAGPCLPTVPEQITQPEQVPLPEHMEYQPSPLTGRSPRSPPCAPPPMRDEGGQLLDIPCGTPARAKPVRRKRSRVRRKTSGRRLDFDATPPSPQTPKRPAPPQRSRFYDEYGSPPEDLMDDYYPVDFKQERTMMDYTPPESLPPPPLQPIPPPLTYFSPFVRAKMPEIPKKYVYRPPPPPRTTFDDDSPLQFPESPEPLSPDELDDFPLATGLPGFPPASPYELPPSPEKVFGRQITPEHRRRGDPRMARLVTPPRERKAPPPAIMAAHKQYLSLLMDTPPEGEGADAGVCPGAARRTPSPAPPSKLIEKTSRTTITPREKRMETTIRETSPATPPMFIMPPRHEDPFSKPADVDLFAEEMPEHMEPSPRGALRRGMEAAPRRTTRKPVQLYGYGERKPITLERRQRPSALGPVAEVADEPPDDYEYWPGPFVPQISKPPVVRPGGRLTPPVYKNVPPVSAKGLRTGDYFSLPEYMERRHVARSPPPTLSPRQARPTKESVPRYKMTARKRLDFEDVHTARNLYTDEVNREIADLSLPEGWDANLPQYPSPPRIDYPSPDLSPVRFASLLPPGAEMLDDVEMPEGFESPRTPKASPEFPEFQSIHIKETIEQVTPPLDLAPMTPVTPVEEMSPPPGMEELELTPPSPIYYSPQSPPEALRQRVREHQYTKHFGAKGRQRRAARSQAPCLRPLEEEPEVLPRTPPYVREETILEITPPPRDAMQEVLSKATEQYASLLDSPEERPPILDDRIPYDVWCGLARPITEPELEKIPRPPIPPTYVPKITPPKMSSPDKFKYGLAWDVRPEDMLDYDDGSIMYGSPPRDIFAEAMEMEEEEEEDIEALLTGSPVRRSPPGSVSHELNKLTASESLDISPRFADDYLVRADGNHATTGHHTHKPHNDYNDLDYCLQKGLDYFPVKENVSPLTEDANFIHYATKDTPPCFVNDINTLLQPRACGQFSRYVIAFYYYLNDEDDDDDTDDDDDDDKPLATSTPRRPVNTPRSFQRDRTPHNLEQLRRCAPATPNAPQGAGICGRTRSPMPAETIYRSPYASFPVLGSHSSVCVSAPAPTGDFGLPLTTPRSQSFQRLSPTGRVNPQSYWESGRAAPRSPTFNTSPTSTLNSSRNTARAFSTLPNMSPYSGYSDASRNTAPHAFNFSSNASRDFATLPSATLNSTGTFATLPNRTNFSHNTTGFATLPSATLNSTGGTFATLPNVTPNTASNFATLPNRTNFSLNTTDFATLPNATLNNTSVFATLPNVTRASTNRNISQSGAGNFATLPNVTPNMVTSACPVNICSCVLSYLLGNAKNAPVPPSPLNLPNPRIDQPKFRTSTPNSPHLYKTTDPCMESCPTMPRGSTMESTIRYRPVTARENTIRDFQSLPHETTFGSSFGYEPPSARRVLNFDDTTHDFQASLGSTIKGSPQSTRVLTAYDGTRRTPSQFGQMPGRRPSPWDDTTRDFRTLPSRTATSSKDWSMDTGPCQVRETRGQRARPWDDTTTDFQTLPNETRRSSGLSSAYINATAEPDRVREAPRRRPRPWDDTTHDFQTLPSQTPSRCASRDCERFARLSNAYTDMDAGKPRGHQLDDTNDLGTLSNDASIEGTMTDCPQSTRLSDNCTDMNIGSEYSREMPRRRPRPWDDTTNDFHTLPNDMSSPCAPGVPAQRNKHASPRVSQRRRPRPWDDTTGDFMTLPSESPCVSRNVSTDLDSSPKNRTMRDSSIPLANRARSSSKDPRGNFPLQRDRQNDTIDPDQLSDQFEPECLGACASGGLDLSYDERTTPESNASYSEFTKIASSDASSDNCNSDCDTACCPIEDNDTTLPVRRRLFDHGEKAPSGKRRSKRQFDNAEANDDSFYDPSKERTSSGERRDGGKDSKRQFDNADANDDSFYDPSKERRSSGERRDGGKDSKIQFDNADSFYDRSKERSPSGERPTRGQSSKTRFDSADANDGVLCDPSCCEDPSDSPRKPPSIKRRSTPHPSELGSHIELHNSQHKSKSGNDKYAEDTAEHFDGLPSTSVAGSKGNDVSSKFYPKIGRTHLVLSACGPLYVTSISESSECITSMKFKPNVERTPRDEFKRGTRSKCCGGCVPGSEKKTCDAECGTEAGQTTEEYKRKYGKKWHDKRDKKAGSADSEEHGKVEQDDKKGDGEVSTNKGVKLDDERKDNATRKVQAEDDQGVDTEETQMKQDDTKEGKDKRPAIEAHSEKTQVNPLTETKSALSPTHGLPARIKDSNILAHKRESKRGSTPLTTPFIGVVNYDTSNRSINKRVCEKSICPKKSLDATISKQECRKCIGLDEIGEKPSAKTEDEPRSSLQEEKSELSEKPSTETEGASQLQAKKSHDSDEAGKGKCIPICAKKSSKIKKSSSHSPNAKQDSSHNRIAKQDSSHNPNVKQNSSHSPTAKSDSSHSPNTKRDSSHSPNAKQDSSHSPNTKQDSSHSPNAKQDSSQSPNVKQDSSHSPNAKSDSSHSPNTKQDSSHSPNAKHDSSHSPNTKQDSSHSPNTKQDSSHSPNAKHDSSHSPNAKHVSLHSPNAKHDSSHSPSVKQDSSHTPNAKQDSSHRPNAKQDSSLSPNAKQDTAPKNSAECLEKEDFVRSIPLECVNYPPGENSVARVCSKVKMQMTDVSTCTQENCEHRPKESQPCLNELCKTGREDATCPADACQGTSLHQRNKALMDPNRTKYFKTKPCLDVSMPTACNNPYCGGAQPSKTTATNNLLLDDWADALDCLDEPDCASKQTERVKESVSDASGCGGAPCGSGPCGSPVSPDLMEKLRRHEFTEGFMDPRRPEAMRRVRSRERVVTLHRRAPSPLLERVREVPEEPVVSPDRRGLMPAIYPTGPPSSSRQYDPESMDIMPKYLRTRPQPRPVRQSPVKAGQRPSPRRRIDFDMAPPSPEPIPDKVTTTETVTYDDPGTSQHVTETTVKETVYKSPRAARSPTRSPQRRSPATPCGVPRPPSDVSPVDFDITEAFGGRRSPDVLDTSDIPEEDVDTEEPFCWLNC